MTEATRFVLPMLYSKDRNDTFFITKNFENCYVGDVNHPELGKKIFLLYNYQMSVEYVKFERKIELMSEFETDYDYSEERQVMYVINIPDEHVDDFQHFLAGRYTKFSNELKLKIIKFWGIEGDEGSLFYGILYANDTAKENLLTNAYDSEEGEYWPKPDLTKEMYTNPN